MVTMCREIEERLKKLFRVRLNIDFDKYDRSFLGKLLLGREICMTPRDLLYVFFDVEKEFEVKIPQSDIVSGKFITFNNIYEIICRQLETGK